MASAGPTRLTGRSAAFRAALAAFSGKGFAADALSILRESAGLDARESAFATEVALGAIRHAITIKHVLGAVARFDSERIDARLRSVLCGAAYQVIWMDRVPAFAAVNESVELAREVISRRAAGMVNALLRNLAGAIQVRGADWEPGNPRHVRVSWSKACVFDRPVLPDPNAVGADALTAHIAAAAGERFDRFKLLVSRWGREAAERAAWASQAVPVTVLYRNALRLDPTEFAARVRMEIGRDSDSGGVEPQDAAFIPPASRVVDTALFREGCVYIQDPTAHAAALLLDATPGESILDYCAAPGGKSIAIAQKMLDRGRILACDPSPQRLEMVRANAERLGLTCIRTGSPSEADPGPGGFDAAMVDVPCSNTGVIARRPEARLSLTRQKLRSLTALQRELLSRAAGLVRSGGRLVYSTCSIEPEENQEIAAAFLASNPNWALRSERAALPNWGARLSDWHDGGYAALLERYA